MDGLSQNSCVTRYESLETLKDQEGLGAGFGLALGVFDGVHLGHQAVIEAARGHGKVGVLTFEPHPVQVLAPERAPRRILASLEHKERIFQDLGVDFVVVLPFTKEFAAQEARAFAQQLTSTGVHCLTAGADWVFGRERVGTTRKLAEWCEGVQVIAVEAVMRDGERISSTRIRQCLRDGNLASAEEMLGRAYAVFGEVKKGKQLGRTIGFPTANVEVAAEQLPDNGVYWIRGRWNGTWYHGAANVGVRPTVAHEGRRSLEVHFIEGRVPDEYGWEVEVAFMRKIRPEMKFSSVEELQGQIRQDIERVQQEAGR